MYVPDQINWHVSRQIMEVDTDPPLPRARPWPASNQYLIKCQIVET